MKKISICIIVLVCAALMLAACGANGNRSDATQTNHTGNPSVSDSDKTTLETESQEPEKRVAKDDAQVQTDDPAMPTRVIENGTRINLHFGDTVLPGILNDCDTAKALIDMLPYTVHMNSYSHDFCGVMPDDLPYNEDEVHYGWLNGDIDYAVNAPYFTILHSDEDISEQYGDQVNIGVLDCELSKIRELSGSYDVLIELAE